MDQTIDLSLKLRVPYQLVLGCSTKYFYTDKKKFICQVNYLKLIY